MERGEKRGQFYLMAAIIIIAILSGLTFIFNYSSLGVYSTQQFYIGEELSIEAEKVMDYALKNSIDSRTLLENFTKTYSNYSEEGDDFYFLFGNRDLITVAGYKKNSNGVFFFDDGKGGGNEQLNLVQGVYSSRNFTSPNETVKITVNGIEYPFLLSPGENFYFVVLKDIDEERYIFQSYNSNLSGGISQQIECGNSIIETGETCDDGNTANGDGCSSTCQIESLTQLTCRQVTETGCVKNFDDECNEWDGGSGTGDCNCHFFGIFCDDRYECYDYETSQCTQNPSCPSGYSQISSSQCTP